MGRRALIVTVVHHPDDARIRHREISALLDAGWLVTFAAPFTRYGQMMPSGQDDLTCVDLPRAVGRRRLTAIRAARQLIRTAADDHDVVVLHDPELLLTLPGLDLPPVVWDVHEDTPATISIKPWLPWLLRAPTAAAVRLVEQLAARRVHLILAEASYVDRFGGGWRVVPNTVRVPDRIDPPGDQRVVYLGHLTRARGAEELVRVGRQLVAATGGQTRLLVIGDADADARRLLEPAAQSGHIDWTGFLPSNIALTRLRGALAGLSLLHDEPNYRHSLPTKVIEYMAYGVPVITTPLPLAADLVRRANCGEVVPFGDSTAVVREVLALRANRDLRVALGAAGHQLAAEEFDWAALAGGFVAELERVATRGDGVRSRR
jgi:glycosyltransferase involved in cell wall biosynthesis